MSTYRTPASSPDLERHLRLAQRQVLFRDKPIAGLLATLIGFALAHVVIVRRNDAEADERVYVLRRRGDYWMSEAARGCRFRDLVMPRIERVKP